MSGTPGSQRSRRRRAAAGAGLSPGKGGFLIALLGALAACAAVAWCPAAEARPHGPASMVHVAVSRVSVTIAEGEHVPPGYTMYGPPPYQFDLVNEPTILRSRPWTVVLTSDPAGSSAAPRLVVYRLYYLAADDTAELWRFGDLDGNDRISGVTFYSGGEPTSNYRPNFNANERTIGEGATCILRGVRNTDAALASPTALFSYLLDFDGNGEPEWMTDVRGKDYRNDITHVSVYLLATPRGSALIERERVTEVGESHLGEADYDGHGPLPPYNLVAVKAGAGSPSIVVAWTTPAVDSPWPVRPSGLDRYVVQRAADSTFSTDVSIRADDLPVDTDFFLDDAGLGATWYYRVAAVDAAGNQGRWSAVVSATTDGP